ncbi:unnamed protein product [Ectocarpus sp. CCAP 1310/34]|nr:unnamed protein product [Ectocarpus sp. CCAP 1310/34]
MSMLIMGRSWVAHGRWAAHGQPMVSTHATSHRAQPIGYRWAAHGLEGGRGAEDGRDGEGRK